MTDTTDHDNTFVTGGRTHWNASEPRASSRAEHRRSRREERARARLLDQADRPRPPRRHTLPTWWPILVCAVLGLAAGGVYGALKIPIYAATGYIIANPDQDTAPATALGFAQAYGRIATSDSTLALAQPSTGVSLTRLRAQIRTETSPESPMISVTGTSKRPAEAADIANAVADALIVTGNQSGNRTGVQLQLFSKATAPTAPESTDPRVDAAVGLCAGALLGGLVLLARPGRPTPEQTLMDMALLSLQEGNGRHRYVDAGRAVPTDEEDGAPPPGLARGWSDTMCRDPWHFTAVSNEWDRPDTRGKAPRERGKDDARPSPDEAW
ncbi:YveK family protein [Streptomyces sp. NPDC092307]|uniref:YveK family protein n=1 Tax=Streptomyces sp. NPDC092307 TaxID=3366013 RepID=UPI003808AAE2